MSTRRQTLLKCMIEEYLRNKEPIGSQTLKISTNLNVSSATIRNHFKAMMEEGLLTQPHISSGRIPTHLAFKDYWRNHLELGSQKCIASLEDLEELSLEIGCFISVCFLEEYQLQAVENINDEFLILKFGEEEVILRHSMPLQRFASELIGMRIEDIQNIAHQVHAKSLLKALRALLEQKEIFYGAKYLAEFMQNKRGERLFFEIVRGEIFKRLSNGIYFDDVLPNGYMLFIQDGLIKDRRARVLCCGSLDRDYLKINEVLV